jgi:hypothetical protein
MSNLEQLQTAVAPRSKRLSDLDAATAGDELNPMAPSQPPTAQAPSSTRPKPRLKTKTGGLALGAPLPSTIQPSFSLAAPGGHFGFRLPASDVGSQHDLDLSSISSGPQSSREGSNFSAVSRASTAPTSRANLVCSLSQGNHDAVRHTPSHSSHLKRLAHASQSGVEAPCRISRVTENVVHQPPAPPLSQRNLRPESQEDQRQPSVPNFPPQSQEPVIPSHHSDDLDDSMSQPPCSMGLWHTALFNHVPLNSSRPHGHTLFATPNETQDCVSQNDNDPPIDEITPSDDDRFAESILRGGKYANTVGFLINHHCMVL